METLHVSLPTPAEFNAFPHKPPYSVQVDLMRHIYTAIERRTQLAVVESPTGTGKTLSLLCSSLTWLCDDNARSRKGKLTTLRESLGSGDDPDWVLMQSFDRLKNELEEAEREYEKRLAYLRRKEKSSSKQGSARVTKRPKLNHHTETAEGEDFDDSFPQNGLFENRQEGQINLEAAYSVERLIHRPISTENSKVSGTKIYYASRTHSQLSQVMNELEKLELVSPTATSVQSSEKPGIDNICTKYIPRTVSLASRNHLCINDKLRSRTSDLDEGCRELLNGRLGERCPYLPSVDEEYRMHEMRDRILANPKDIEDLVSVGKSLNICPYFGSRAAVQSAEFVTLPYNLLLHKRARETLDIDLEGHIVIIDEAHNLVDAILQLHTVDLTVSLLRLAISQLQTYLDGFRTRLNATHALHLKRLILFLTALDQIARARVAEVKGKRGNRNSRDVVSVSAFVENMGSKVNGINLLELQAYLVESKVSRKIYGFYERRDNKEGHGEENSGKAGATLLPLHTVEAFISSLTNDKRDGIITFYQDTRTEELHVKYQHLNPASHFSEILNDARCVILAGGTMSPIPDVVMQLFPSGTEDRISTFSCGHVVPRSSIRCLVVGKGPRGKELQFKFKERANEEILDELGQVLFNLVNVVPCGMVVFFPSYSFLETAKTAWSNNGLLMKLQKKKQIFYEPSESSRVEHVLREYGSASVTAGSTSKGAILFAVVGAKLSEGLNFADDLARAVVLIGLPYPNLAAPELNERMKYVTELAKSHSLGLQMTKDAGQELYENLCMRAVNQSIGRAVRHRNDWSALVLLDSRYGSQKVRNKLPAWINQDIIVTQSFGQVVKSLGEFYRDKQ
ncbi:hypothetical protein M0805_001562 [Coniferiporia weirii]|nr:hypothetical protein M0805_001562 [Coniferiporia weirii]